MNRNQGLWAPQGCLGSGDLGDGSGWGGGGGGWKGQPCRLRKLVMSEQGLLGQGPTSRSFASVY